MAEEEGIFKEIKDDIKQEKYERLITVHGYKILSVAIAIVVIAAAYNIYKSTKYNNSVEVGRTFYKAFEGNKPELYDEVFATDHEGYKTLASFAKAGVLKTQDKIQEAIETLDKVETDDSALKDYAKLSSLYLKTLDEKIWLGKEAEISSGFEALYNSNSPFSLSAKQSHALFLYKLGSEDKARNLFSDIALADDASPATVERAKKFIKIIDGS